MPRRAAKTERHGANSGTGTESFRLALKDFSVYDYSRSSKDSPRNNLRTTSKLTRECKSLLEEQEWYEKDLSDFEDPQLSDEEHEAQSSIIRTKHRPSANQVFDDDHQRQARDYPIDLWFLIAMYISPEDVGRFSLICRSSHHVVNTVVFWMRLFRRHNRIESTKIGRILVRERLSVIRTHVIKSLHQIYPVFQERLNKTDVIHQDPHFLLLSRCVRIWYSKRLPTSTQRDSYNYYFEFRFDNLQKSKPQLQAQASSLALQDTNQYFIDKNCCILHLICSSFVPIGPYMGMILSQITLNISSDYRYHKLKMWFDSSRLCLPASKKYNDSVIIIDPILCLKIYNWYNSPSHFE